jgi:aspartate carbamoyltransferase catalytic subunit
MPTSKSSLINFSALSKSKIESLFEKSLQLKSQNNLGNFPSVNANGKTAALLFFEPSTRTRFSFEAACVRAGYHPLILDGVSGTSLEKGETVIDTILNIEALRPLFFVIRCGADLNLEELGNQISTPILNAGWGHHGHPTQALLDTLTVYEKLKAVENKKILFVGDIKHSRVVASHFQLAKLLNYQIGICAPDSFLPTEKNYQRFENLDEGLQWADAVMALRVQKERHDGKPFDTENYRKAYGLNLTRLTKLSDKALIMHPGPINYGTELEAEVLTDSRSVVLQQVENGVFLREALIRQLFKETEE